MPVSKALLRLLRVRSLEEEQRKLALETELARLHRTEAALEACKARERHGRTLARTEDVVDRQAAKIEIETARRQGKVLERRRAEAEREASRLRELFLEKRTERRQAESLIEGAKARDEMEERQRAQQRLDEWHAFRREATNDHGRQDFGKDEGNVSGAGADAPDAGKTFRF